MTKPMRIATGAVIDYPIPQSLRQIDIIIWNPFPAPAIFDVNGFGLVPKSSAFGVIEVKRSFYSGVDVKLEEFMADVETRKIVSDPLNSSSLDNRLAGIGVICVLETNVSSRLRTLISDQKVIAIFEKVGEETIVRRRDVLVLVNFLHFITWRYRIHGSQSSYLQLPVKKLD
jgi:hypothetical protein